MRIQYDQAKDEYHVVFSTSELKGVSAAESLKSEINILSKKFQDFTKDTTAVSASPATKPVVTGTSNPSAGTKPTTTTTAPTKGA